MSDQEMAERSVTITVPVLGDAGILLATVTADTLDEAIEAGALLGQDERVRAELWQYELARAAS